MKKWAVATCVVLAALTMAGAAQVRRLPQVPSQRNNAAIRPEQLILAADRIRADRWYPPDSLSDSARELSRSADMDLLVLASTSEYPRLRQIAVREFGRFETVENAEYISRFLEDEDPDVRIEAADALVQTLIGRADLALTVAIQPIELRLLREIEPRVIAALWRTLTQLPLPHDISMRLERQLVDEIRLAGPLRIEAGLVLVELLWNLRGRPALAETLQSLREWFLLGATKGEDVLLGNVNIGRAETFLEGLQAARVDDDYVLDRAAVSPGPLLRVRAVEMHNPHNPRHRDVLEEMARGTDVWTQDPAVRRLLDGTDVPLCDLLPLAERPETRVKVIEALGAAKGATTKGCGDWSPDRALLLLAEELREAAGTRTWQAPMAALEALAPRMPQEAGALARVTAAVHHHWLVRATAARVAAVSGDSDLALRLSDDRHANVRADALRSLMTLRHPLALPSVLTALEARDYHLVRTAALLLEDARDPATLLQSVMSALDRVSKEGKDTSRETRLALLARVQEFGLRSPTDGPAWAVTLRPYLEDFDPVIAEAASSVISSLTGNKPQARPKFRPALQPTEMDLRLTPPCLIIEFDDADPWTMTMERQRAPIATERFWRLARQGYYNGQDVVQSDDTVALVGSPGGNEYVSADRYIRDEMGGPQRAGSVVMLGHGRDTLDGRLRLGRKDQRDLDRRETVIGRVATSFDLRSPLLRPALPGNTIVRVRTCDTEK